jgi:hypothetical protein
MLSLNTNTHGGKRHGDDKDQEPQPIPYDAVGDPDGKPAEHPAALRPHEDRGGQCQRERRPDDEHPRCCRCGQHRANYEQSEHDSPSIGIRVVEHQSLNGDDAHQDEGVLTATAEDLLEGSQPSPLQVLAPLGALVFVITVIWSGADSQTVWYLIRGAGVIAYVLLALSVVVGLLISGRMVPPGRARVDIYEVHTFTSLLALAFGLAHALTLLLDNFTTFTPAQILIPFTSNYRPFPVALGIIGIYLTAAVYGSFWIRRRIGYRNWRVFHYTTFASFVLLTAHAILSGTDARTLWLVFIMIAASVMVSVLTVYRIASRQRTAPGAA